MCIQKRNRLRTFPNTPSDSVAFITGAASGMGLATATAFAAAGITKIVLVDLKLDALEQASKGIKVAANRGVQLLLSVADVSNEDQVVGAVQGAVNKFGAIHFAVHCAGINQQPRSMTHETPTEVFEKVAGINYRGTWLVERELLRVMVKQDPIKTWDFDQGLRGSIVTISSNSIKGPLPIFSPYATSKAAVSMLAHADGKSYGPHGIRINCIAPGVIATPMNLSSRQAGENFSDMLARIPQGRIGEAVEIAHTALFLSHPKTTYLQGQTIFVDGGYTLC
ncbi:NAD(P)-binding protein [Meredithblackwellia eburnea MCA 4105]